MLKPRNTLVLVHLVEKPEERIGALIVPAHDKEFTEAEVVAVGPGQIMAAGAQSETFDLKAGDRVLVRHKKKLQRPNSLGGTDIRYQDDGLKLTPDQGQDLYLFEQSNILAIVG